MRRLGGVAIILHGSGSDSAFVRAAFEQPLARAGLRLVAPDDRTGDPVAMARRLRRLVSMHPDARVVGGVSVGAHAVARWAAHDERAAELEGLLLVMPAWTGTDSGTAAITEASAKALRREGVHAELLRMSLDRSLQHDWVMSELSRAWPRQADTLAAALLRTARSRGPYISELAQLNQPVGIVALADDVLHPESVADRWHHYLRRSAVVQVARHAPAKDRSVIGVAAVQALQRARRRTAPMHTTTAAH